MKTILMLLILYSCSRTAKIDSIKELEEQLLVDNNIDKAPVRDPFLEDKNYVGPLNDQLNPFEQQNKEEDLFANDDVVRDRTGYKEEFQSVDQIIKDKNSIDGLKEGEYESNTVGPYEKMLTIEKLAMEDNDYEVPVKIKNNIESDWSKGKDSLAKVLDVAPLTTNELREFLADGRKKRKPELKLRNKDILRAAYNGTVESMKYLLKSGLNINTINKKGETALMIATKKGRVEIVQFLLKNGANKRLKNKMGEDADFLARKSKNSKLIELFSY